MQPDLAMSADPEVLRQERIRPRMTKVRDGTLSERRPAEPRQSRGSSRADLARIRKLCLALPQATERMSHGVPCFFVRDKTMFAMFLDNHHDDGRLAIWCAASNGMQQDLIAHDPGRFFRPPYVGHRGWIGVRLDIRPDWQQIAAFVIDAYRIVAPRSLVAELERLANQS
jgi:hypothetical protein